MTQSFASPSRTRRYPLVAVVLLALVAVSFAPARAYAQDAQPAAAQDAGAKDAQVTEDDVIAGTMNIDFKTRTNPDTSGDLKKGSPAVGAQDKYNFVLSVAKTTEFAGDIMRQPK